MTEQRGDTAQIRSSYRYQDPADLTPSPRERRLARVSPQYWRSMLHGRVMPAACAVTAAVLGIVLRVAVIASRLGPVDADEAVVGLMARDLLRGRVEAFYWGQEYGGIHEQLLVALLLLVRIPGWLVMELAPVAWSAAAAILTWRIGRRVMGDGGLDGGTRTGAGTGTNIGALLAGAFMWLSSGAFVWLSTKERGFYGATLVAGLLTLLLALRLAEQQPARRRDAVLLGVALGTGWYASPQIAYLALPAGLVVLTALLAPERRTGVVRQLPAVTLGAIVGALPWILVNLRTGFASFELAATLPPTTYGDRLSIFFRHALPIASGLKVPFTLDWLVPPARLAYAAFLAGTAAVAVIALVRRRRTWPLAVGVLAYPLLYAVFPTSYYYGDPRYLYLLWPMIALLVVDAAHRLHAMAAILTVAVAAAVGVVGLQRMASLPWTPDQATHDIAPLDVAPAVEALEGNGDRYAYADYWLSYRITFASDGDVTAAPLQLIRSARIERVVAGAARRAPVPYVLVAGSCYDRELRDALTETGIGFDVQRAGRVAIVRPAQAVTRPDVAAVWAAC